jgi:chaperonin GroES
MKIKFKPLYDRVLVRKAEPPKSAILIPDSAMRKPSQGEVVAVGDGYPFQDTIVPLKVKVKDQVLFAAGEGQEITIEGEKLLVFKEMQLIGIL